MTFIASNGVELDEHGVHLNPFSRKTEEIHAARIEFYRHLEDERLGRERWSENPDYVFYPRGIAGIRVVSESSGDSLLAIREKALLWTAGESTFFSAARAYFEAHPEPEPRPWEDAKVGDIWLLTVDGKESAFISSRMTFFSTGVTIDKKAARITAGRRIWPEWKV